jgi:Putative zinc-finger
MSTQLLPPCPLGLTPETLAAWHDGALESPEEARVASHVMECPSCRARLADIDAVEHLVRSERAPEPDTRLWQGVRARYAGGRLTWTRRGCTGRRWWPVASGLGAVAAVVLLALGFAQVFGGLDLRAPNGPTSSPLRRPSSATATASPEPSPTLAPAVGPGQPLVWQAVTMPPGFVAAHVLNDILAPSPANGQVAYACMTPLDGPSSDWHAWATQDAGQSWTALPAPPNAGSVGDCGLVADTGRAEVVALGIGRNGPPGPPDQVYLSTTGGTLWQAVPSGMEIISLATFAHAGLHIYAVTGSTDPTSGATPRVQMSNDGGATWTPIDAGLVSQHVSPLAVWVGREVGDLLVRGTTDTHAPALYHSSDGGATWRLWASVQPGLFSVAEPAPGLSWRICRLTQAGMVPTGLDCSLTSQGPLHFTPIPPIAAAPGAPWGYSQSVPTITTDGSLLAIAPDADPTATGANWMLYRLRPGASAWESIGPLPEFTVTDAFTGSGDVLWAQPANGMELDPQGRVFIARVGG